MRPELVSSIIPRALNGHPLQGALVPSIPTPSSVSPSHPRTLPELATVLEEDERRDNPDLVTPASSLRLTDEGFVEVPRLGAFAMTDWSRRQLATAVGMRWDRFFENASPKDRAEEMNRRLDRATDTVRVRTRGLSNPHPDLDRGVAGELRALVSAGYSPVSDARLARHLVELLRPADAELRLVRHDLTDRTTSFVVKLGDTYRAGDAHAQVGDIWGGILVRNSGVGFASLMLTLHLTRLLCKNGMTAPLPDALLMKRRHRGIDDSALRELLSSKLEDVAGRLHQGQTRLRAATERRVEDVPAALLEILHTAELPQRLLPALLAAYGREPIPTAFGVSQAFTLAAQMMSPEERLELEQAAGAYLTLN